MLDNTQLNDRRLSAEDIGQLENATQLVHFFARLKYDVDQSMPLDHAALGLDSEDLRRQIRHIRLVAKSPDDEISIYLMEVRSVTVQLTQAITRRFRERPGSNMLVLTSNYESLDFVLLEPQVNKSRSLGRPYRRTLRPRVLTVSRRKPGDVDLRVLQRFTFTEGDGIFQWDKLRSAYTLAEWSEQYFNNRALFSDYYLQQRLTDPQITPAWDENVRPIGREVMQRLAEARQKFTHMKEEVVRRELFEPLFTALGFTFREQKLGTSSAEEPDYWLYANAGDEQPVAAALTYVWNRNLDDMDLQRDPDTEEEIPGALVVSLLEKGDVPWVIMTNGKLWRLYSTTADNKATNYYEIDLEEAVTAKDQLRALKYWWLFFRRGAFTGFLDDLLRQSEDYAKGLRERLKDRVFEEIFPHFAAGFIQDIRRAAGNPQAGFNDESLELIYAGTLTFLYRLMFVLYAESLELLPLNEERGYRPASLYALKSEIAAHAGTILDEAPDRLRQAYGETSTKLYTHLSALFAWIDRGAQELNLPTYNGGLFSQTSESGEFLADYAIPDRHLALGLDRLCRDLDDKTQALVFIDFKSLGVRQLGSIYEGLLEFKLRIAPEELAVVKEKGKEVYIPRKKAGNKRVYATIPKGAAYLENDKRERKATGSYYTPDYIVKYIVEHTVGPVLDRKFEDLAPRLREVQKQFRQHQKLVAARGNDQPADLLWRTDDMRQLANDCLNVRVLDPAMGSGHFLVEAVDFVSNRLIDFLNGWSENPVWGLLDETRETILQDMERQGVTIDPAKLTRVALLKRSVLKRCVYGVDLNPMAVELAKVSLWLDAFTLGAPLSFLDHHLKHGNSLIGARVAEVREAMHAKAGEQMSLLARSKFTGMMLATDLMRQVSYLNDNTVEQVTQSREAYRDARDHLAPYKRVLDVYTSRWFGNEPTKKSGFEPVIEFLKRVDTQAWIENADVESLPKNDYMNVRQVAYTADKAAHEKRFFHWELEFPEVFFASSKPGEQDVQLREEGGFDAVIGNPPYQVMENIDEEQRTYFYSLKPDGSKIYEGAESKANIYSIFWEASLAQLTTEAHLGMITPFSWVSNSSFRELRGFLRSNATLRFISAFDVGVFENVGIATGIFIIQNKLPAQNDTVDLLDARNIDIPQLARILTEDSKPIQNVEATKLWKEDDIVNLAYQKGAETILAKFGNQTVWLSAICNVVYGCKTADTSAFTGSEYVPNRNSKDNVLQSGVISER